jgi:predicted pyridoxine 5'-phosphate oxidase superfamily flavin-nucleotide-binding protein
MLKLEQLRNCFEGYIPSTIATCDADGIPNVSYVSQVHYVDSQHIALTFQFFNKTRRNILENPQATVLIADPYSAAKYQLAVLYRRTEESGSLFESMKAKLAGLASESGMQDVFVLKGADIYQVLSIEAQDCAGHGLVPAGDPLLVLKQLMQQLNQAQDLAQLFQLTMLALQQGLAIEHAMLLIADESAAKLYTVETVGYAQSGIGSEIPVGCGVIGTAALYKTPIRVGNAAQDYNYLQLLHKCPEASLQPSLETLIAYPGLAQPQSQLAVPVLLSQRLLAVLYVESEQVRRFSYSDEDVLTCLAMQLGLHMARLQPAEPETELTCPQMRTEVISQGHMVGIRYFSRDHSVFVEQDYLIKGVAGAILWRLLSLYQQQGRVQFSNRELRLDKALNLPEIDDNLETRLLLLQRRLAERCDFIQIRKTGRGSFQLEVQRALQLVCQN